MRLLKFFPILFVLAAITASSRAKPLSKAGLSVSTVSTAVGDSSLVSNEKREIPLVRTTLNTGASQQPRYRFLLQGGLHGNEQLTSRFVMWLAKRIANNSSPLNAITNKRVQFDFLPIANPDGVKKNSRYNANQINLNRNFGVLWGYSAENPGSSEFSEPETRAIRALMRQQKYTAAVDVHGYINWIVGPSALGRIEDRSRKQNQAYARWISAMRSELPKLGDYEFKTAGELGDGGAFEDWAFWENDTYAFCLEMASAFRYSSDSSSKSKRIDQFEAYEAYITAMFKKAIDLDNDKSLQRAPVILSEN